jgi:hypothetical protein
VVALPDTQYYAEKYPEIYDAQTQWIVDNLTTERIAFVTHLGDLVDNGPSVRQWTNAQQSMALLDSADVPYGVCLGNHDFQYSDSEYQYPASVDSSCSSFTDLDCAASHFVDAFGPKHFAGRSWYGGASPSGQSNYQTITAGGFKLLFLHLAADARAAELTWAQQVLDKHKDAAVHLATHRYMYDFRLNSTLPYPLSIFTGGRYVDLIYDFDQAPYYTDATKAEDLFEKLVKTNSNIFMVHCGHVDAELREQSTNAAGLPVHELLVDFQDFSPNGGDGWMRLLRFKPHAGEVQVRTYSPHLKRFRTNGEGYQASLTAMKAYANYYGNRFKGLIDLPTLLAKLDYWATDPTGKQEGFQLMYGDGRRDSEFTLKLDLAAYAAKS